MDKQPNQMFDDDVALDGPDYVALVIEWDEIADNLENEITERNAAALPSAQPARKRLQLGTIAGVLGALGVFAFAGWGIHRIRTA